MSSRMMMNLFGNATFSFTSKPLISEECATGGLQAFIQNASAESVSVNYIWNLFYKDQPPPQSFDGYGYQDCPDGSEEYAHIQSAAIATNTAASPTKLWKPATNSGIAVIGIL